MIRLEEDQNRLVKPYTAPFKLIIYSACARLKALKLVKITFLGMFTKIFLNKVKKKAMRNNVWFKALDFMERNILNLATRLVDRVKSELLGIILVRIVKKILVALKSSYVKLSEQYGLEQAKKFSTHAVEWGYAAAKKWAHNLDFARYLTLIKMNAQEGWKY